jgi:TPR repeat protein
VRGQRLLEKGCNEGDAEGCRRAAALHEGPERIALVRKACNLGDPAACVDLARSLYFGIGVVRDPQQAQQLLQQVCSVDTDEDGGEGCFLLAQLLSAQGAGAAAAQIDALYQRACDKEHFDACIKVVNLHYVNADYDKAVELSTKLITDNGSHWLPRYTRGMSLFDLGRFAEAEPDLEQLCALRPEWVYCELWLYAARERAGKDGDAGLQAAAKNVDLTHWPGPVVTFFLGNKGEAQLLREAKSPDRQKELEQLCEAYFYVGQKLLTRGNPTKAMAMFQKAVDTGITNFVEYASARAELARRTPAPRAGP